MAVTGADLIAGYRLDRTLEGPKRTLYSYLYNGLIGVLFGWPHRDINFSFKLMKREVIDAVELKSEGSLIDAELVVKAKNRGFLIQQIGLDYFPRIRGQSHLSSPKVILKIFAELIKLYPEMRRKVHPECGWQAGRERRINSGTATTEIFHDERGAESSTPLRHR